jgi:hypothetical protein
MASIKTAAAVNEVTPRYHITDAHGNHHVLRQIPVPVLGAATSAALVLESGGSRIVLSQTNATDLVAALTGFGNTGVLS